MGMEGRKIRGRKGNLIEIRRGAMRDGGKQNRGNEEMRNGHQKGNNKK